MIHPENMQPGSLIELPELGGHANGTTFEVVSTHPGGMGICFHLRSCKAGEHFALKCVRSDLLGESDSINRFHDELDIWLSASACDAVAEAVAIVRINEIPCVLAKWMKGGDLAGALPDLLPQEKFQLILRIVRGLRWVHEKLGVIHRDLKPANVLLDNRKVAYLADWGLARPLQRIREETVGNATEVKKLERPDRTSAQSFLGTVMYAAPEQLLDASTVDHRADIYALGCIMFEMEMGRPPFSGQTVEEIAQQVLHQPAPKLGGLLRKTALGLERIIARCLAKTPSERFADYRELELAILEVARRRQISVTNCQVGQRYERHQLGKGQKALSALIEDTSQRTAEYALLELDDVIGFIQEADNLMALNRFQEAEKILRHYFGPGLSETGENWHLGHTFAEKYAFCLQHLPEKLGESQAVYAGLSSISEKPAVFFINYSLALLRSGDSQSALDVCERGLRHFPRDLGILGNRTIALIDQGNLDAARDAALQRLDIRRDVHSLEETGGVLAQLRDMARDNDLPNAIKLAKIQFDLIREGLALNPWFASLRITEIQAFRFAHAESAALEACNAMIHDDKVHADYRQLAIVELVDQFGSGENFRTGLEMIEKALPNMSFSHAKRRIQTVKWTIYADKLMIGKHNLDGQRIVIPQVIEFFLREENGCYPYPLMAARILEWLERFDEAEDLFRKEAHRGWEARWRMAQLLLRLNRLDEANDWCDYLLQTCQWRAEAYDTCAMVAKAKKDTQSFAKLKLKGDEVFEQEMAMFGRLRNAISIGGSSSRV